MIVQVTAIYRVVMDQVRECENLIEYPFLDLTINFRNKQRMYRFPLGSYTGVNRFKQLKLTDSPHYNYVILKNFRQTLKSRFGGNVENYVIHCVKNLAPDFISEVDAMYYQEDMIKRENANIKELAEDLVTDHANTITVDVKM